MAERTYIIPLRREFIKSPLYKRAKKSVNVVRRFLEKHMKSNDVRLGQQINLALWKRGIKNPPGKIKVTANKDDKGVVRAELFGHKYIEKKVEKKVEKSKLEQLKEKITGTGAKEEPTKEQIENKEAITHVPEHTEHKHIAKDHSKELKAASEKERKVATGSEQAHHKNKN